MMRKVLVSSSLLLFVELYPSPSSDSNFSSSRSFWFAGSRHTDDDSFACLFAQTVMVARLSDVVPPKCTPNSSEILADRLNG